MAQYQQFNPANLLSEFEAFLRTIGFLYKLLQSKIKSARKKKAIKREQLFSLNDGDGFAPKAKTRIIKFSIKTVNPFLEFQTMVKTLKYHSEQLYLQYSRRLTSE
jgi:alanyl-tRNA synthetase